MYADECHPSALRSYASSMFSISMSAMPPDDGGGMVMMS